MRASFCGVLSSRSGERIEQLDGQKPKADCTRPKKTKKQTSKKEKRKSACRTHKLVDFRLTAVHNGIFPGFFFSYFVPLLYLPPWRRVRRRAAY
jgi:hypothetical protein